VCPECERQFGRRNQPHECSPAMSLEEYFSTGPERERPIFEAVVAHLDGVGPVHVEPVSVGIFLKKSRTFAQLRPKRDWVDLMFVLSRVVHDPHIARRIGGPGQRTWHIVKLRGEDDVDDEVREWLTESYLASPTDD
jgi:hypothetical protein